MAIADRIVINKKDLLNEKELEILKEDLQSVNSVADMIVTERSRWGGEVLDKDVYSITDLTL